MTMIRAGFNWTLNIVPLGHDFWNSENYWQKEKIYKGMDFAIDCNAKCIELIVEVKIFALVSHVGRGCGGREE